MGRPGRTLGGGFWGEVWAAKGARGSWVKSSLTVSGGRIAWARRGLDAQPRGVNSEKP